MLYNIGHQQFTPRAEYTGVVRHKGKQMSTSNDTVYIYALQRISDKAFLYIGSAKNPQGRFYNHKLRNPYAIIREAFNQNNLRFLVIASTDESHRTEIEARLWKQFKDAGHPIVNRDPTIAWKKHDTSRGKKFTESHRRNLSSSLKGHVVSSETKAKISASKKGKTSDKLKGRKFSDRHKLNISIAAQQRKCSDETKRKMSIAQLGRRHTEETKKKMSESAKIREARKKQKKANGDL